MLRNRISSSYNNDTKDDKMSFENTSPTVRTAL